MHACISLIMRKARVPSDEMSRWIDGYPQLGRHDYYVNYAYDMVVYEDINV